MAQDRLHGKKTLKVSGFLDEFEKDDIKKYIDIVDLFHHFGITLTKKGKSYMARCPWHDDTNPSLSVDREKDDGVYHCFGCGESGDIFTLTEKMKGVDFKEGVRYLKGFKGSPIPKSLVKSSTGKGNGNGEISEPAVPREAIKLAASSGTPKTDVVEEDLMPDDAEHDNSKVESITLTTVADYYHKKLYDNPKAIEYIKKRGFDKPEIYARFKIGFADGSLLSKISENQKETLKQSGILSERGQEHFKDCVTFPIIDEFDVIVGMYGRSIDPSSKKPHLYLKGKHKGVFNRKASKVYDEIILTESIIDALSLIELGIDNVQPIYGTNGFTDEHLHILKDDRVKTIVLAFDSDEAGSRASLSLKDKLVTEGFRVKMLVPSSILPGGLYIKDWNEYLVAKGSVDAIREQIANAEIQEPENDTNFTATKDALGHVFTINEITYRVTGVKDMFISSLRVNVRAEIKETALKYYDNLDLYSARSRNTFSQNLSREFNIEPKRIEHDVIKILEHLECERDRVFVSARSDKEDIGLTQEERELGLSFLKSPEMFTELVQDMDMLGYVGEDLNKQLMYIAATSRKLDDPISVMVVSESASGKSLLIDTVARLIPPYEVISVTSLSEQALNYMEDLSHKFVSLGEIVHSETIEHQIREMLSKRELSRLVTTKEPQSGNMVTKMVKIPAIVSLAMSGTRYDMNPENTSRCFMVNADESRAQTRRIHEQQWTKKYSLERKNEKKELVPEIIRKHHAAQKLLSGITIVNPFGRYLDFPNTLMRTRRDNERFVDLIACVCYLRQYQKEKKYDANDEPYIEYDLTDYEIAYNIMIKGVLSSSLLEIPRGAIDLYEYIRELARKKAKKENIEAREAGMTQREIREYTGLNQVWVKRIIKILLDFEYLTLARGGRARSKGHYQLREDVSMEEVNLAMIPTPEELKQRLEGKK